MIYDVAIIGGGPVGLAAVNVLAPTGQKIIMFEKSRLGGTCLNEGCMPTKALLHSANVLSTVQTAPQFGVEVNQVQAQYQQIAARKSQLIAMLQQGTSQKIDQSGITLISAEAQLAGEDSEGVIQLTANGETYKAKKVIIGAGSENFVPPIPGLDSTTYMSSREVLELEEAPKSLTVIGGGVLGMEFASLFATLGVPVDLIEMSAEILPNMDRELAGMVRSYYEGKGIKFHLGAKAQKAEEKTIWVSKEGKEYAVTNDAILLAVGRKPATEKLNLKSLNIKTERGAIVVNESMQTSHPHVYASGDSIGGSMLAHTALQEGAVAAMSILGHKHQVNYQAIPSVVYTNPELAGVGYSEEALVKENIPFHTVKAPLAASGRFFLDNTMDTPNLFKAFVHKETQEVLGVHILGNPSSELIAIAGIAIQKKMTVNELKSMVFPHPTVSAIFGHAF